MSNLLGGLVHKGIRSSGVGRGGGGGSSPVVTLPWQLTFDSDDPITGGVVPTFDDETWREDGNSTYSIQSTPTIDGYSPSSLFDKTLRMVAGATYASAWFQYSMQPLERHIDPSGGLRVLVLSGMEDADQQHRALGTVYAQGATIADSVGGVAFGASTKNNPDQVNLEYKNNSGSWVDLINWGNIATSTTTYATWQATKLTIPAGFSGNGTVALKTLGSHANEASASAAFAGSWADVLFDVLYFGTGNRANANARMHFGMFWVGSLTDDWPV